MLKVIHYGLGPIGAEAARLALGRKNLRVLGAVELDETKVGRDLGELLDLPGKTGVRVAQTLAEALRAGGQPDVVIHATSSRLGEVLGQLEEIARAGARRTRSST